MKKIINCEDCGTEIVKHMNTYRCKPCQVKVNQQRQRDWNADPVRKALRLQRNRAIAAEKRILTGKKARKVKEIKEIKPLLTKKEYLVENKPKMIAFLNACADEKDEDIDLMWCDSFIDYMSNFYNTGAQQRYNYKDEVNWYITKIIKEYSK